MSTEASTPPSAEDLAGRLFESTIAAIDVFSVYLGEQLGYYASLAGQGRATSTELAARTGTHERYAREWLEQQVTTGILAVDDSRAAPTDRRYSLPEGYAAVLVDPLSEIFAAPVGRFVAAAVGQAPALLDAYRTGGGVSWADFGKDAREAQADFNRPFFHHHLAADYLANVPGLADALAASGARIAEIGFGGGWAAIAMALGFPNASVTGFDIDGPSVDLAKKNVAQAGLSGRVELRHEDAGAAGIDGQFDLVCAFECIHDMSDPVSVLRTMRRLAKPSGTVLVMDERVGDEFGNVGDFNERFFYGFSISVCLPDGLSHQPSVGTGTVMRAPTLRRYALEAGFSDAEVLPLEHDFYQFYRLVP